MQAYEPPEDDGELDKCQEIRAEMDAVEAEIAKNGGVNCGWDDADHKDFLRLRTKHNNKTVTVAFITAVNRAVPTADEIAVREHVRAYERYQDLTKKKKELIVQFKEAKEEQRVQKLTSMNAKNRGAKKLNADLDLGMGSARNNSAAGARSSAGMQSMEERILMKDQLREWKNKKNEADNKERLDRIQAEKKMQQKLKKKLEAEREAKRNMLEEYKFKKEMDKQREQDIEKLEKRKQ